MGYEEGLDVIEGCASAFCMPCDDEVNAIVSVDGSEESMV